MIHFKNCVFIDLTHKLHPHVPTWWSGSCGFCLEVKKEYDPLFRIQQIKMHGGVGTHMDAPSHRFPGAASIADIALEQLIVPICMMDLSSKASADYELSEIEILEHEKEHGKIPKNALFIAFTGWSRLWSDPEAYRNKDSQGEMHFPSLSSASAKLLLERDVAGIAIDTLSPDCRDLDFTVHRLLLGAGKYIIENIADCSAVPARGSYAIALPLRAEEAAESPIRLIAIKSR